ncbi:MAG: exodeoxyribonuclease V subunit beta [Chromatiales bacterium]|jgi:exodeoxyribonuclease V beta subunit
MKSLDLTRVPLSGLNLVEASAGTGKTHTLTGLYLRLLLELSLNPEQILVVTYTKAATAELKERIRRRLVETRQAFLDGTGDDNLIRHLLQGSNDRATSVKQLDLAIAGFDQAAIYTIHGFCQRVLSEHALETGQAFDVELVPDESARLQQIADDFWRLRLTDLSHALAEWVQDNFGSPEGLLAQVGQGLGKPYLELRSAQWPGDLQRLDRELLEQLQALRAVWRQDGVAIRRFLSQSKQLKRNVYRRDRVGNWLEEFEQWLQQDPHDLQGCTSLKRFGRRVLESALAKDGKLIETQFFDLCQVIERLIEGRAEAYQGAIGCLRREFYDYLLQELPRRRQAAGEWSYDDLLQQLHLALLGGQGRRLATLLQRRYPAALVDEFQDTDPVQYDILERIYGTDRQSVFLVGDPKQAIYSFRGADIFAYLTARNRIREAYSLDRNWRSTPQLIQALNTLFGRHPNAFFFPEIPFQPVSAANSDQDGLHESGDRAGHLRIWQITSAGNARLPELRQQVADGTAEEIARLLRLAREGRLKLGDRPMDGGDIAVLVRKHSQGERIARALTARGIHSVRSAQDNVFLSREAEQLERLLLALLEPRREPLLRAALATDLLGWRGAEIDRLNRDDGLLGEQFERFLDYHQGWRDQGFIRMFRRLQFERDLERRLLAYRDGERRLTNLYQLVELLHRHDSERRPGMEGLVKWFSRQRQEQTGNEEERQLRLESDSHLVKIVTQHASKGLQYPVVFCPYLWDENLGLRSAQRSYLFHDPTTAYQAVFEMGSPAFFDSQRYYKQEELAENLRLLYVALTRARYRCYLPWGKVKNSEHSALAWLLYPAAAGEETLAGWQKRFKGLKPAEIQQGLEALAAAAAGTISLLPLPMAQAGEQLSIDLPPALGPARRFQGVIPGGPRISSFSSLVAGLAAELPDHDATLAREPSGQTEVLSDIHGFPKGAQPGTCLHSIFEQLDFTADSRAELEQLVAGQLSDFAIETRWGPVIADMVQAVLSTPLDASGLRLRDIDLGHRISELEFHFPIHRLEPRALETLARQEGFSRSEAILSVFRELTFPEIQGYMTGFIDLVLEWQGRFYLLDYKSNWLGEDRHAYTQEQLRQAMLVHHYPIQYLFYTLALHRYLARRVADYDYDRHFGGVFYLFLRGMDPALGSDSGVFQERPSRSFIEALDRYLAEGYT